MEYYSAIKRNAFESILLRWMNLEPITQSEVSHQEKYKYCVLTHTYGILRDGTDEFIFSTVTDGKSDREQSYGHGGRRGGRGWGKWTE